MRGCTRVMSEARYADSSIEEAVLKRTERKVLCFDLIVRARAEHAVPPPLSKILQSWKARFDADDCSHPRNHGRIVFRLGDINIDEHNGVACLLIRQCDVDAANAAYGHKVTGELRVIPKEDGEGGEKAAHFTISTVVNAAHEHHYLCHLEVVPGLSHSLVQATLNGILKNSIKAIDQNFNYPDPAGARVAGGAPKLIDFVPHIELLGHPSPTLSEDLENGRITGLTLVQTNEKASLGGYRYLTELDHKIEVKVSPGLPKQNRMTNIFTALRVGNPDYGKVRVRFDDPDGLARSVEFDIENESTDDSKYIRSYLVKEIDPPMDEATDKIVPFLRDALKNKLIEERG
jgi:hypothetical protein